MAAAPAPESAMVVAAVALLETLMLPVALPLLAGENAAVNGALWPGASMVPDGIPLALKPGPETLTLEIATLPLPTFVIVTV